jgi:hypothetical protein
MLPCAPSEGSHPSSPCTKTTQYHGQSSAGVRSGQITTFAPVVVAWQRKSKHIKNPLYGTLKVGGVCDCAEGTCQVRIKDVTFDGRGDMFLKVGEIEAEEFIRKIRDALPRYDPKGVPIAVPLRHDPAAKDRRTPPRSLREVT